MKIIQCRTAVLMFALFLNQAAAQDPWAANDLIQPRSLAAILGGAGQSLLTVIFVGFPVLYRGAHIPAAILAGPASKPEGLGALKSAVRELPRDRDIVLYCGCCPFVKCPNVRPAYAVLHWMGFSHVKVLMIETNLHTDWVAKGYPVEKG